MVRWMSLAGAVCAVSIFYVAGCGMANKSVSPKVGPVSSTQPAAMTYVIRRAAVTPALDGKWDSGAWKDANVAEVKNFHAKSSDHHPKTQVKVLYDDKGLYVFFHVQDQYVKSVKTGYQSFVWEDSAAEFFVQPKADSGYFNFEINCGGTMLLRYIEGLDPANPHAKVGSTYPPNEWMDTVKIHHSMPATVPNEITTPVTWELVYFIPYSLLEHYAGKLPAPGKREFRGNFYKCGDNTSHPHWASWSPIGEQLNFHQPQYFGTLKFEVPK